MKRAAVSRLRRIYLASSWRNMQQPALVAWLRDIGHEVYDFRNPGPGDNGFSWKSIDPNWERWTGPEYLRRARSQGDSRDACSPASRDAETQAVTGASVMDVKQLAKERVELQATLRAITMWNTSDKTLEQLTAAEVKRIETMKRLNEVEGLILSYINGEEA